MSLVYKANAEERIWIKPNKGQWHQNVKYLIKIPGGDMFLESNGFTYQFHNGNDLIHGHNHEGHEHDHGDHNDHDDDDTDLKAHVVKTKFLGANFHPTFTELKPSPHVENYFIGNDASKWVSNLKLFNQLNYNELYPGIGLNIYEHEQTLKYDVLVAPGADISKYRVKYDGQESIQVVDGNLFITTTLGTITEQKPYAFQMIDGKEEEIECHYQLKGNIVTFNFPNGYDHTLPLVIDPVLLFSTFTGSTGDNWGMTACPDINDKLIAAGIVFASGYPVTAGAINASANPTTTPGAFGSAGVCDIGLTKFNATGTGVEFSTYIGGNGSETPHSVIVNDQNEIFLMGATSSSTFPVTPNGYQTVFQGGPSVTPHNIGFTAGSDIFVLRINPTGSNILRGTYIGGTGTDGISTGNSIAYNYGDRLRGEIIVGSNSTVYISSTTASTNFPIAGGFQNSLGGSQDAVFIKLDNTLSNLMYSSYIGGSGLESGNSIQLSSAGDLFVAGGTTSNNFPFTTGQLNPNFIGGSTDGYVIKLEGPNYSNPKATYLGTTDYDQSYFVQLDLNDKVYVYGQTAGNYTVSPGRYANTNSGQFIHKLDNNLTTTEWSSVFGGSTGDTEISPTAFLISDCYEIYVAGWGGTVNGAVSSTTNGFPVTPDAYQNTTSGSNFWIGVFDPDMVGLKYGTFMGNTNHVGTQGDHVDGGTSRFSKGGKIFHAVCAACGGLNSGFPTTPGVYSPNNGSSNCNMASFVFDLAQIEAALGAPIPVTCLPNATVFTNSSINGNTYTWYFGDGDSSSLFSPTHLYPGPGIYDVMLIVSDSNGCYTPDTAFVQVEVILPVYDAFAFEDTICPGTSVQVTASGGTSYIWSPPSLFTNAGIQSPFGTFSTDTTISVQITSVCGSVSLDVDIWMHEVNTEADGDTAICVGETTPLTASGGVSYNWDNGLTLSDSTIASPIAEPIESTVYTLIITTAETCLDTHYIPVHVDQGLPQPVIQGAGKICLGNEQQLIASGATSYTWSPNYNISNVNVFNPTVWPTVDTTYQIEFSNACGDKIAQASIDVIDIEPTIRPDTSVCPFEPVSLWAGGGDFYSWEPEEFVKNPSGQNPIAITSKSRRYVARVSDKIGCYDTIGFWINVFDLPKITVSDDIFAISGDPVPIWAKGDGSIEWFPKSYIDCDVCKETEVSPPRNENYTAILTDMNGCQVQDDVAIIYSPLIYVPNAFTPDGNEYNNVFKAVTNNIIEFEMTIYNRWGEIVFQSFDTEGFWDGSYAGKPAQDGVYVWKIHYTDLNEARELLVGHVTLLR